MISEQAKALTYRDIVHYTGNRFCTRTEGPRGGVTETVERWCVNGEVQTWKREPERFRVPIKYGQREYGAIRPDNVQDFHIASECPAGIR